MPIYGEAKIKSMARSASGSFKTSKWEVESQRRSLRRKCKQSLSGLRGSATLACVIEDNLSIDRTSTPGIWRDYTNKGNACRRWAEETTKHLRPQDRESALLARLTKPKDRHKYRNTVCYTTHFNYISPYMPIRLRLAEEEAAYKQLWGFSSKEMRYLQAYKACQQILIYDHARFNRSLPGSELYFLSNGSSAFRVVDPKKESEYATGKLLGMHDIDRFLAYGYAEEAILWASRINYGCSSS